MTTDTSKPELFFNQESNGELNSIVDFLLDHLRQESGYLDKVIECSLQMKDVLSTRDKDGQLQRGDSHVALAELQNDLQREFAPIREGRTRMAESLQEMTVHFDAPPTVSSLAPRLDESAKRELKSLRDDIKTKLNEIRAITMSNQAILMYTLDFYHRLLGGFTNQSPSSNAYNKSGQLTNQVGGSVLQKNC